MCNFEPVRCGSIWPLWFIDYGFAIRLRGTSFAGTAGLTDGLMAGVGLTFAAGDAEFVLEFGLELEFELEFAFAFTLAFEFALVFFET